MSQAPQADEDRGPTTGYNRRIMGDEPKRLTLQCPECQARLVVDAATGAVIHHRAVERAPAGGKDFDALLQDLDRSKAEAEEIWSREVSALEDHDRLMEEKFEEAFKRAKEEPEDERPVRPFDLD